MNKMMKVRALVALAAGLLTVGCQPDAPTGPATDDVVDTDGTDSTDTAGTDGTDAGTEFPRPQPTACGIEADQITVRSSAGTVGALLPPLLDFSVTATPSELIDEPGTTLPVTTMRAFIQPCSCTADPDKPGNEHCSTFELIEMTEQDGAWVIDGWTPDDLLKDAGLEGEATRAYCIGVQGTVGLPDGSPDHWQAPDCASATTFLVDGDCPEITGLPDTSGGPPLWFRTGTLEVGLSDLSGVAEATVLASDGSTVATLYDTNTLIEPDDAGVIGIEAEIDVCAYGPDVENFVVRVSDVHGQTCDHALPVDVLPCPRFVGGNELAPLESMAPSSFTAFDINGDSDMDIVAATPSGVVVYSNHEGSLRRPRTIPGLAEEGASFVIPDHLDNDGYPDYIVIGKPSEQGTPVSVYLWKPECEHDWERFEAERQDMVTSSGDPNAFPAQIHAKCKRVNPADPQSDLVRSLARVHDFLVPAEVTTHLYSNVAAHPDEAETDKKFDLVVGTDADAYTVGILLRKGGTTCRFQEPVWDSLKVDLTDLSAGLLVPEPSCFEAPTYAAGAGGGKVTALAAEDFFVDGNNLTDIAVAYQEPPVVSVFRQVPDATQPVRLVTSNPTDPMPSHAVQLIVYPGTGDFVDVLAVLEDAQQVWQLFGTGDAQGFQHQAQVAPVGLVRRTSCIEGGPAGVAVGYFDEQAPGAPIGLPDLLVANRVTGALWTLRGTTPTSLGAPGYTFTPQAIVDGLRDPRQLATMHVDDDGFLDAVLLNDAGTIAVVYGANPTLPATDPDYGPAGLFLSARHLTTPIPAPQFFNACVVPQTNAVEQVSEEGTPLDRLEPQFVVKGNFDSDQFTDLAVVAERTKKIGTGVNGVPLVNMVPVFFFRAPRIDQQALAPYIPLERVTLPSGFSKKFNLLPYVDRCPAGAPDCVTPVGTAKGPMVAVAAGPMEPGANKDDLVFAQATFYNGPMVVAGSNFEPQPALDIAFTSANLNYEQASFPHLTKDSPWEQLGYIVGSRPSDIALFHCDNNPSVQELAIVQEESGVDGVPPTNFRRPNLKIYRPDGDQLVEEASFKMPNDTDVLALLATRLGNPGGGVDRTDLLVSTGPGVRVYRGLDNSCNFEHVGQVDVGFNPRIVTAGDLDGDGLAELVTGLVGGSISLRKGQDGGSQFLQVPSGLEVEGAQFNAIELLDVNGDGFRDILALDIAKAKIFAFLHTGVELKFWPEPFDISVAPGTTSFFTHDFDGDQCQELVTISPQAKAVTVLRNRGPLTGNCILSQ